MSVERRINPLTEKNQDRLKAIAGLLQKLSYREMHRLAELVQKKVLNDAGYPNALLAAADEILSAEKTPKSPHPRDTPICGGNI